MADAAEAAKLLKQILNHGKIGAALEAAEGSLHHADKHARAAFASGVAKAVKGAHLDSIASLSDGAWHHVQRKLSEWEVDESSLRVLHASRARASDNK